MSQNFILPALWGLVLLVSFIGYGASLRRLLFARDEFGWANEAAWGMAFFLVLGGLLISVNAVSAALLLILIVVGCILWLADLSRAKSRLADEVSQLRAHLQLHPWAFTLKMLGFFCLVAIVGIFYLHDVVERSSSDDIKGYFTLADQIIEKGGFAIDPFNGMRLQNGLGGQSLLHALMLSLFDYQNLYLIDGGVALIIAAGLVWRIGKERHLGYPWRWALALFFLSVPYYPFLRLNSSSLTTGMVMFLALFAFLDRDTIRDEAPVRNALVIGMLAASACALKTNLIPPCVVILALSYLWHAISAHSKKQAVLEALLVPCFVFLMLLPWMLALLHTSGTLLYPILGMGFDESSYGNYLTENYAGGLALGQKLAIAWEHYFSRDIYLALLLTGTAGMVVARMKRRATVQAFVLGSILAVIIILFKADISNPLPFYRYLFVCVFTSLLVALAALMEYVSRRVAQLKPTSLGQYLAALPGDWMACIALLALLGTGGAFFGYYQLATPAGPLYVGNMREMFGKYLGEITEEVNAEGKLIPEADYARYRNAQESVPVGEAIFSRDDETILYHYGRNPIYDINDPGSCSPAPGLPYFQGPEAVAAYLLANHIRYVAYSYKDQAGYPVMDNLWRLAPDRPYDHRVMERAKVALDRVLGELGASRKRVFDDGELFVIDLQTPAALPRVYRDPNYFQAGKILTLAWAATRGFDRNKVWTDGHGVIEDISYQPDAQDDMLVLNTFGYHPWKQDMGKLRLSVSVNGVPLHGIAKNDNTYCFALPPTKQPITSITIDSATFVPRDEKVRFGKADDRLTLGIDVDTIQISNKETYFQQHRN